MGAARAGVTDLLRLGAKLGGSWIGHPAAADPSGVVCRWARELMEREGAEGLELRLGSHTIHVLGDERRSAAVLGAQPGRDGWVVSPIKVEAMSFLAAHALTVTDGPEWSRLRALNERVLATGRLHPFAPTFLGHVRSAFERPVRDHEDVRAVMGRAMVDIVLGEAGAGEDPARDVTVLFDHVQSPLKRKLTGFLQKRRRARLYRILERRWDESRPDEQTLIAQARAHGDRIAKRVLLEQVPHWMFTFTGSGTDLLARTLALVTARPLVLRRIVAELSAAGPLDRAETIAGLPYLTACILETGRLFPPVTRTLHREVAGSGNGGEVVHWFPLLQRDDRLGDSVHEFRPDRWLGAEPDVAATASNLFLRGPRQCPGMSLILFVCRGALARQIGELGVAVSAPGRLARDPLPVSFPTRVTRFTTRRTP